MYKIEMVKHYYEESGDSYWAAKVNGVIFHLNKDNMDYCRFLDEWYYPYEFSYIFNEEELDSLLMEADIKKIHLRYLIFLVNAEMELLRVSGEL